MSHDGNSSQLLTFCTFFPSFLTIWYFAVTCYFTPKYFSTYLLKSRPFLCNQGIIITLRKFYIVIILILLILKSIVPIMILKGCFLFFDGGCNLGSYSSRHIFVLSLCFRTVHQPFSYYLMKLTFQKRPGGCFADCPSIWICPVVSLWIDKSLLWQE